MQKRRRKKKNGPGTKLRERRPNAEEGTTLAANPYTAVPVNTLPPPPSDAHPVDPVGSDLSSTDHDSSSYGSFRLKFCESVAPDIRDVCPS